MNDKTILKKSFLLTILLLTIIIFGIVNTINSALFGNYSTDRKVVYIFIGLIILIELIVIFFIKVKIKKILVLLCAFLFYILFLNLLLEINVWELLIQCGIIFLWTITFMVFNNYDFSKKGTVKIVYYSIVLINLIFLALSIISKNKIDEMKSNNNAVINLSYFYLSTIPIMLINYNKRISIATLFLSIFIPIFSLKRGAIITSILMILAYFLTIKKINKNISILKLFLTFIILLFSLFIVMYLVNIFTSGYLFKRFEWQNLLEGSGRKEIIIDFIKNLKNRNLKDLFFGTGSGSSTKQIGITLHNDFFEVMFCYGIFGLIIYIMIIIEIIKFGLNLLKCKSNYAIIIIPMIAFVLSSSLFEGTIFNFSFLYIIIQISFIDNLNRNGLYLWKPKE